MNTPLWPRRFGIIFGIAFVVIAGAQLLRGRSREDAVIHSLVWSTVSATIFVAAQAHRERRKQRCVVCEAIDGSSSDGERAV